MQACALARQSVAHAIDGLINGTPASLQGVRTCEEKLDDLDRELDERMAETITRVTPAQARELLACLKLMLDLERVGDLVASFAERSSIVRNRIEMEDVEQLTRMACLLENMLVQMAQAFEQRNVDQALHVLRSDAEIDRLRNLLLVRQRSTMNGSGQARRACTCSQWPMLWSARVTMSRIWRRALPHGHGPHHPASAPFQRQTGGAALPGLAGQTRRRPEITKNN